MDIIGIVCEYNPFHNGHLYQIKEIKKMFPNSIIVVILDGYFSQRGDISCITKEDKVKDAIASGVDLVIELPILYATQSADIFANSAIRLLNELKVKKLVFGSETNDIETLKKIAMKQLDKSFDEKVKKYMKDNINYPTALKKALDIDFDYNNPNDLLAISYIKAILKNNYNITPVSIKRTNDYHDISSDNSIISASNIRNKIVNSIDISKYVPIVNKYYSNSYFNYLKLCIIHSNLNSILDVDEGLDNKILSVINKVDNIEDLIAGIKSKRYTYNRINRMLTHILLDIKKSDALLDDYYIRILGFNEKGKKYLNSIKKDISIPLYSNKLTSKAKDYEIKSSIIYDLINNTDTYQYEIKNKPIN